VALTWAPAWGKLHRKATHRARSAVDQDALAGVERTGQMQALPGRHGRHRQRGGLHHAQALGQERQLVGIHRDQIGIGTQATQRTHDTVAHA
jgi:hypothetical protein